MTLLLQLGLDQSLLFLLLVRFSPEPLQVVVESARASLLLKIQLITSNHFPSVFRGVIGVFV